MIICYFGDFHERNRRGHSTSNCLALFGAQKKGFVGIRDDERITDGLRPKVKGKQFDVIIEKGGLGISCRSQAHPNLTYESDTFKFLTPFFSESMPRCFFPIDLLTDGNQSL